VADQGIQIAIQNGGGLRASIDGGEVTMGEVFTVLPFQNTLATFQLTGAGVMEALENGVSQVEEGAGRFPQVAGLRYHLGPVGRARPASSRSRSTWAARGSHWTWRRPTAWCPTTSCAAAATATAVFIGAMNAYDFGPGLEEVVATYLGENSPYTPYTDGRISEAE
jgi:5'-nucleotidase/UDP-sugar diphosphatase